MLPAYARGRPSTKARAQMEVSASGTKTYQVASGQYESVYANMPRFGLAVAGTHEPATEHLRDARSRMNPRAPQAAELPKRVFLAEGHGALRKPPSIKSF